tara:strand:+ start:3992 stop:4321 length:330 start_codon:yes stop_codon:yes gene_type:complete
MAKKCGSPVKFVMASMIPHAQALIPDAMNAQRQLTQVPPASGMQQMVDRGLVRDNFGGSSRCVADQVFGSPMQRQMSMPGNPIMFEDQTGDGKITQADVIKARTEGYKE